MYFTYQIEDSLLKINFTYKISNSPMELKQFTYEITFLYVKLHCEIFVMVTFDLLVILARYLLKILACKEF